MCGINGADYTEVMAQILPNHGVKKVRMRASDTIVYEQTSAMIEEICSYTVTSETGRIR